MSGGQPSKRVLKALLSQIADQGPARAALLASLSCGMRLSEMLELTVTDLRRSS
jgi:hypothetical protein